MSKLSISEAAKIKGVSTSTLRKWELEGKLIPERTANGHRRYDLAQLLGIRSELSYTIGYCHVSSHDQKDDLIRQKEVLDLFCVQNGWQHEIIEDLGSGLDYSKKGLKKDWGLSIRMEQGSILDDEENYGNAESVEFLSLDNFPSRSRYFPDAGGDSLLGWFVFQCLPIFRYLAVSWTDPQVLTNV